MAEAKPTTPEGVDIARTVEYLREREKELSRYSDKLRKAVQRIANVFGDPDECQVCGEPVEPRWERGYLKGTAHYKYVEDLSKLSVQELNERSLWAQKAKGCGGVEPRYSDEPKEGFKPNPNYHKPIPKIYVSIDVEDEEPFYVDEEFGVEMRLALEDGELGVKEIAGRERTTPRKISELPREMVKMMVKSGRLVKFFEVIRRQLDETTSEYKQVAEIAERIASIL